MAKPGAPPPPELRRHLLPRHSWKRPLRQKEPPLPTRRSARRPADPAVRAPPGATPASDSVRPEDKLAPRTTVLAPTELPARPRAARASPADSTATVGRRAVRSDRSALRFAEVHLRALSSGSRRPPTCHSSRR